MKNSARAKSLRPPAALSPEARRQWREIQEAYEIDDAAGGLLLNQAMFAFDEIRSAQAILKKDGPIVTDRFGQPRQHPATLVLRDARNLMLRSLKALNLDIAPAMPLGTK